MSDSLLEGARRGNQQAIANIYDGYALAIYRYAYRRMGDQQLAQDVMSQTFHRFLRAMRNGGGPDRNLSAWLYRVAHNLIVDYYRRQPPEPPADVESVALTDETSLSQETRLVKEQEVHRVRTALQQLTSLQQQVIALRFLEDMSIKDVAEVMGKTEGSIKALQHRGINSLRRILEAEDGAG